MPASISVATAVGWHLGQRGLEISAEVINLSSKSGTVRTVAVWGLWEAAMREKKLREIEGIAGSIKQIAGECQEFRVRACG